jgi:hypothetical protein
MSTVSIIGTGVIFCVTLPPFFTPAVAQEDQAEIKHARPSDAHVVSGEEMYRTYYAVCRGIDGEGGGPVTPALRERVPDLTILSQSHGGKYPAQYVENVFRFGTEKGFPAHGNRDMQIWGRVFASMPNSDRSAVTRRIRDLTQYLETLQTR